MNTYLTRYFDTHIKPLNDKLGEMLDGESLINSFPPYTKDGITHIHVFDTSDEYELLDGHWVEKAPF